MVENGVDRRLDDGGGGGGLTVIAFIMPSANNLL